MTTNIGRGKLIAWQVAFLFLGTSWLWAPGLNHVLSGRSTLISQYETSGQPYAWLFRLCDFLAGALVFWLAYKYLRPKIDRLAYRLVLIIGAGLMLDPILATDCLVKGGACQENFSLAFILHAAETTVTALAFIALALYDANQRKKLVSILFVIFQIAYGVLFASQLSDHEHFNTASQYVYQCVILVWLAWLCRDYLSGSFAVGLGRRTVSVVRYLIAGWAVINGLLAIIISLAHIHLLGKIKGLYFAGDNAWLAQHGVIIGVIMLYLSRHIYRGEMRARQIFLGIAGLEALKYAVITPHHLLLLLYVVTFCALFVTVDEFDRGIIPMTWRLRLKDLAFMAIALMAAAALVLILLDRDDQVSKIAGRSFDNFGDYALHADSFHKTHKESVLLANTATAFFGVSAGTFFWILFRPYKSTAANRRDFPKVRELLDLYSNSSEDFFKLWPVDKQYFWSKDGQGFVAYKAVGPVAFALADPISPPEQQVNVIREFIEWCRAHRLRACFQPVFEPRLNLYKGLSSLQIGASALVDTKKFMEETSKDKWWRWKRNRAARHGYSYAVSQPPHSPDFIQSIREVSDNWLATGGHQERQFALGYFDKNYLQQCDIHYLMDETQHVQAFANLIPVFNDSRTATIDLLRFTSEAQDSMAFLLCNVIEALHPDYTYFDLGFVPFAETKGPIQSIARTLSASRFSAKGLEQFKNKFDPDWQPNYLAYDGDFADLALIALNLERAMEKE